MNKLWLAVVSVVLAGCGVSSAEVQESGDFLGEQDSALVSTNARPVNARPMNGRGVNGRPVNGRAVNARPVNGRAVNGLVYGFSINGVAVSPGLRDATFDGWFNEDPAGSDIAFRYLYRCAAPASTTVTYTATSGVTYSWPGTLGMAPRWATTAPIADDAAFVLEQESVTSCLLGLTNALATPVSISARGPGLTLSAGEDTAYPNAEGAFFGNIFLETPVSYACHDAFNLECAQRLGGGTFSSCQYIKGRTCATDPTSCSMSAAGTCSSICSSGANGSFAACTMGGRSWTKVLRTRVQPFCGDGRCGSSEMCRPDCGERLGPNK